MNDEFNTPAETPETPVETTPAEQPMPETPAMPETPETPEETAAV